MAGLSALLAVWALRISPAAADPPRPRALRLALAGVQVLDSSGS